MVVVDASSRVDFDCSIDGIEAAVIASSSSLVLSLLRALPLPWESSGTGDTLLRQLESLLQQRGTEIGTIDSALMRKAAVTMGGAELMEKFRHTVLPHGQKRNASRPVVAALVEARAVLALSVVVAAFATLLLTG